MNQKIRAVGAGVLVAVWLSLTLFAWLKPAQLQSESERRKLSQLPSFSLSALLDGTYMSGFSDCAVDQFPLRDTFRSIKALFQHNALLQQDNNGYFVYDGYIVKQTYPLSQSSVNYAANTLNKLYDSYLKDTQCQVYFGLVPDKGYFLQEQGYPTMDYASLEQSLQQSLPWAKFVQLQDTLELEDYYKTDTHWRQETLLDTADALCQAMGAQLPQAQDFTAQKVDVPFYGVYYGHAALPLPGEELYLLRSDLLDGCTVTDPITGKTLPLYDESKLTSADMYEVFLSGNQPILHLENPNATTRKELVIFRDSFGSAIAPLLAQGYARVTLIDIRYISQGMLADYMTFQNQDVLFLYSTLVLNESNTMKR